MLTLDDLGLLLDELLYVIPNWYFLGIQLKLSVEILDRIRERFHFDFKDCLLEMLKTWLTTSDNTSWKTLTDALRSRSVGASQLADDLEAKYCLMEETELYVGPLAAETQMSVSTETQKIPTSLQGEAQMRMTG